MARGPGAFAHPTGLTVGHLNSVSDPGEGNLTVENKKNSNARGCARGDVDGA